MEVRRGCQGRAVMKVTAEPAALLYKRRRRGLPPPPAPPHGDRRALIRPGFSARGDRSRNIAPKSLTENDVIEINALEQPLSSCADLIRASTWLRLTLCLRRGVDGRG